MSTEKELTDKQKDFCDEYLVDMNARAAAIRAGYSRTTANKGTLINLPQVQAYIAKEQVANAHRIQVTKEMILQELAKIAFTNIGAYYHTDGSVKKLEELDDKAKAALANLKVDDVYGPGKKEKIGETIRIKVHNKMAALDKLAKHLGFYKQRGGFQSWN